MKRQKIYPRLCAIKNWGTAYGFSLTSRKFNNGDEYHFINDVVESSSAGNAGLRKHDRVIEVNGVCIEKENHRQIVKRILINKRSVSLLVLTESDYELYRKSGYPSSVLIPYATIIESSDHKVQVQYPFKMKHSKSVKENFEYKNADQLSRTYRLEDLVLRSDSWTRNEAKVKGDSILPRRSVSTHDSNTHEASPSQSSSNRTKHRPISMILNNKHQVSISPNTPAVNGPTTATNVLTSKSDSKNDSSNSDSVVNQKTVFSTTNRKNPRNIAKHNSLAIRDKMKILNEL